MRVEGEAVREIDGAVVEEIGKRFREPLERYVEILLAMNRVTRLVGPDDPETLWREHVLDCLAGTPLLPTQGSVLDIGSGGGLPGLVWAIARPDLRVVLCESIGKKAKALFELAEALGLRNVRVLGFRSEEVAGRERERFDLVGARAVAHLGVVAEYAAPLVAVGGFFLAMKGPAWVEENDEVAGRWHELSFALPEAFTYHLEEKERFLVRFAKTSLLTSRFPRRPGMAEKNNWWR